MTNPRNSHIGISGAVKWWEMWQRSGFYQFLSFVLVLVSLAEKKLRDKPASAEAGSITCKCHDLLCKSTIQSFKENVKHCETASLHQDFQAQNDRSDGKILTDFCSASRQQAFSP